MFRRVFGSMGADLSASIYSSDMILVAQQQQRGKATTSKFATGAQDDAAMKIKKIIADTLKKDRKKQDGELEKIGKIKKPSSQPLPPSALGTKPLLPSAYVATFKANPSLWIEVQDLMSGKKQIESGGDNAASFGGSIPTGVFSMSRTDPIPNSDGRWRGGEHANGYRFMMVDLSFTEEGQRINLTWVKLPGTNFTLNGMVVAHTKGSEPKEEFEDGVLGASIGTNLWCKSENKGLRLVFSFDPRAVPTQSKGGKSEIFSSCGGFRFKPLTGSFPGTATKWLVVKGIGADILVDEDEGPKRRKRTEKTTSVASSSSPNVVLSANGVSDL